MARVTLELPEQFCFQTELDVLISHINYGGHVGNDAVLSLVHEARLRFFKSLGYTELDIEGYGIILADAVIVFRAEGFHGNRVRIDVALTDFSQRGCDMMYRLVELDQGRELARAKTGIVFFDYQQRKVADIPAPFLAKVEALSTTAAL